MLSLARTSRRVGSLTEQGRMPWQKVRCAATRKRRNPRPITTRRRRAPRRRRPPMSRKASPSPACRRAARASASFTPLIPANRENQGRSNELSLCGPGARLRGKGQSVELTYALKPPASNLAGYKEAPHENLPTRDHADFRHGAGRIVARCAAADRRRRTGGADA